MAFAPATTEDEQRMLVAIGADSIDQLFEVIPPDLRSGQDLDIPPGIAESELVAEFTRLARRNVDMTSELSFLGYGSWDHHVPAVCQAITQRSEFATAYTPYQPEVSQGTLQAIFEFQTAMCELTGLPVSNASLYDGATAAAEAMYLAQQASGRSRAVVLRSVAGPVRAVLRTYARAYGMQLEEVPFDPGTGVTDADALQRYVGTDTACLIIQQPNAFGCFEPAPELVEAARSAGALPIVSCDPLSLGVLEAPGAYGAAIAVGDGQALGNASSFGGPTFGFMAAEHALVRRMPGRIVGETIDAGGRRAYALTLQTREQHIRREKATSNICTNQALNALAGIVYLSWLGPAGLEQLGNLLVDRITQASERLLRVDGVRAAFTGPSFKELVVQLPMPARSVIDWCKRRGVHPGFAIGTDYPELGEGALLVSVTEKRSDDELETLASAVAEAVAQ